MVWFVQAEVREMLEEFALATACDLPGTTDAAMGLRACYDKSGTNRPQTRGRAAAKWGNDGAEKAIRERDRERSTENAPQHTPPGNSAPIRS